MGNLAVGDSIVEQTDEIDVEIWVGH
jgi:hypothetical protein